MPGIPRRLQSHINTAFPNDVCLIGTVLPNGYAQITPRGSTQVFDDQHFSLWERGRGSTAENLADGTRVTIFFASRNFVPTAFCRKEELRGFMEPPGSSSRDLSMKKSGRG